MAFDVLAFVEEQNRSYDKSSLSLLSSKYFRLYRVLISYAFNGDFSKSLSDEVLRSRMIQAYEIVKDAVQQNKISLDILDGDVEIAVTNIIRELKNKSKYLISSKLRDGSYEYRVTGEAYRAFAAVDELSQVGHSEFSGARIDTILHELTKCEQLLSGDVDARVAQIEEEIHDLEQKRVDLIVNGVEKPSVHTLQDSLWNLVSLVDSLPVCVRTLADDVKLRGKQFRSDIESGTISLSRELKVFSKDMLEMIGDSDNGRSYLDAMSILTNSTHDLDSIEDRFEELEDKLVKEGVDAVGSISGLWHMLASTCNDVSEAGQANVQATSSAIKSRQYHSGTRRSVLENNALQALKKSRKSEFVIPWGVSQISADWLYDTNVIDNTDVSTFIAPTVTGHEPDYEFLQMLGGPRTKALVNAMCEVAPAGVCSACEVFNSLSVEYRRLVELGSLRSALVSLGFAVGDIVTWNLIDVDEVEHAWASEDLIGVFHE